MNYFLHFLSVLSLFTCNNLFRQAWQWAEDKSVLNPSGLEIQDNVTMFQVIDWDGDNDLDLVADSTTFWLNRGTNLAPMKIPTESFGRRRSQQMKVLHLKFNIDKICPILQDLTQYA